MLGLLECCVLLFLFLFILRIYYADCDAVLHLYQRYAKKPGPRLKGKIVWITGASSGIGEHLAYRLAQYGCKLVLSARRKDELERVKAQCMSTYQITWSSVTLGLFFSHVQSTTFQLDLPPNALLIPARPTFLTCHQIWGLNYILVKDLNCRRGAVQGRTESNFPFHYTLLLHESRQRRGVKWNNGQQTEFED